jgi:hypothetical protein
MVKNLIAGGAVVAAMVAGCKPNLGDTVSIVKNPLVLAIRSELLVTNAGGAAPMPPATQEAEAKPTENIKLTALFVGPSGPVTPSPLQWAFCGERKPLAELGPVNPLCLKVDGDGFTPLGTGSEVTGAIPTDACQQFGHDTPLAPRSGQPPGRPVDPDPSGGYYQPTRLLDPDPDHPTITIGETRIQCTLASLSADVVAAFQQRYHRNSNPEVASLGVKGAPAPLIATADANGTPNQVGVGQHLALEVSWPACPKMDAADDGVCGPDETGTTCGTCGSDVGVSPNDCCVDVNCKHALGCAGAERYVLLDPTSGALVDRRESMAVAWFATGGAFDFDRTGRSSEDDDVGATTSDNAWQAPDKPDTVTMWVVLRDARGGVGWKQFTLDVQ